MSKKPTKLPALTNLEAIKEALDVRLGRRGDKLDKAVTFRDLQGTGKFGARLRGGDVELYPELPEGSGGEDVDLETWVPSAPTGFEAKPMFGGIFLKWDWPPKFGAIGYTEVYRATSNDASKRELLIIGDRLSYVDKIDGADETEYFYWVRFRSLGDIVGPFTGPVSAVSQRPVKDIMDELEADIKSSYAYQDITAGVVPFDEQYASDIKRLETRVAEIKKRVKQRVDQIKSKLADRKAQIKTQLGAKQLDPNTITDEQIDTYLTLSGSTANAALEMAEMAFNAIYTTQDGLTRLESLDVDEDSALYTRFFEVDQSIGDASGRITAIEDLTIDEGSSLYTKLNDIEVTANGASAGVGSILKLGAGTDGTAFAEFVEAMTVTDSRGGYATFQETKKLAEDLSGEYSIKLDNNGNVAGFGLYNTTGQPSAFTVRADKFYVVNENDQGSNNTPFIVKNGNTYIRSAYIEQAFVDDLLADSLTATEAFVGDAVIDWAQITNVDIVEADIKDGEITNAKIGNVIQSDNFQSGSRGWRIKKDGNAEFNSADFRGTINFADLRVDGQMPTETRTVSGDTNSVKTSNFTWHTLFNERESFRTSAESGYLVVSGTYKFAGRLTGTVELSSNLGPDGAERKSYSCSSKFEFELSVGVDGNGWNTVYRTVVDGPSAGGSVNVDGGQTARVVVEESNDYYFSFFGVVPVGTKTGNFNTYVKLSCYIRTSGNSGPTGRVFATNLYNGQATLHRF